MAGVCRLYGVLMTGEPFHTHIPPKTGYISKHVKTRFAVSCVTFIGRDHFIKEEAFSIAIK